MQHSIFNLINTIHDQVNDIFLNITPVDTTMKFQVVKQFYPSEVKDFHYLSHEREDWRIIDRLFYMFLSQILVCLEPARYTLQNNAPNMYKSCFRQLVLEGKNIEQQQQQQPPVHEEKKTSSQSSLSIHDIILRHTRDSWSSFMDSMVEQVNMISRNEDSDDDIPDLIDEID